MGHPTAELIAYLREELSAPDRERVAGHLAACTSCRAACEDFRRLLDVLRAPAPAPPAPAWGPYRAELRERLAARTAPARWWRRPVPLALSAALAGALAALAWMVVLPERPRPDATVFEESLRGHLDLIRQRPVVERLDLLEDLDVITQLDRLAAQDG